MFFIYILKCNDGSYYVGHTNNLECRLAEHNNAEGGFYTSNRLPIELVYTEEFQTREEASSMEKQIKGWSRRKKEALIEKNSEMLTILASRAKKSLKALC